MVLLHDAVNEKKFDVRVVERHVQRGVIAAEDVQKQLNQLPDDSENAEYTNLEVLEGTADESETSSGSH